jgi:hypothetical protein
VAHQQCVSAFSLPVPHVIISEVSNPNITSARVKGCKFSKFRKPEPIFGKFSQIIFIDFFQKFIEL